MLLKGLLLKASWIADTGTISLLVTASGGVGVLTLSLGNAARDPALPVRAASLWIAPQHRPKIAHALQPAE